MTPASYGAVGNGPVLLSALTSAAGDTAAPSGTVAGDRATDQRRPPLVPVLASPSAAILERVSSVDHEITAVAYPQNFVPSPVALAAQRLRPVAVLMRLGFAAEQFVTLRNGPSGAFCQPGHVVSAQSPPPGAGGNMGTLPISASAGEMPVPHAPPVHENTRCGPCSTGRRETRPCTAAFR